MKELTIQGIKIKAGEKANIEIPIAKLPTHTLIYLPVFIRSSLHEGPVVLISGGVHGDEINGIATAKKLLEAFDEELDQFGEQSSLFPWSIFMVSFPIAVLFLMAVT